jgi:hypothetical protein
LLSKDDPISAEYDAPYASELTKCIKTKTLTDFSQRC